MGQCLLLVDSDRGFVKEHGVTLASSFEFECLQTADGVLDRLGSGVYAAVLICVEVNENKGYALCSAIRKTPGLEGIKVILISAKATEEEFQRHRGLKVRADLYLHKPMTPSTLVAALAPFVPTRAVDPDNPLGGMTDTGLGSDWLAGLRSSLEGPLAEDHSAATVRLEAAGAERVRILEEEMQALHEELRSRDRRLQAAEVATAEAQMSISEGEALRFDLEARLDRVGSEVRNLQLELEESQTAQGDLRQQAEALTHDATEKAQALVDLLQERDHLLQATLDQDQLQARVAELQEAMDLQAAAAAIERQALQEAVAAGEQALAASHQEREEALQFWSDAEATRETAAEAHRQALQEAIAAGEQALAEGLQAGEAALAAVRADLEAAQQAQAEQEALRTELGAAHQHQLKLEAALAAARADLEATQQAEVERDTLRTELEAAHQAQAELEAARTAQDAAVTDLRQTAEAQEQRAQAAEEALRQHQEQGSLTEAQLDELHRQQEEVRTQHERERLELMVALEEKEAEAARIVDVLSALEEEKQALAAEAAAQRDRLGSLQALLGDAQEALRRAADLARGQE